ncbi:Serine/threonine-protein kinase haspin [Clonorchis sinensis]|uniref:non-specific serine/threonine protein kinase n=1 Tax=Clonorchis sinensis TaxID=79923 RepID=A0A8T1N1Z6_CLOSI|nr:Serine/threonine-protein kinase haspin [Clonorchis sinensis]
MAHRSEYQTSVSDLFASLDQNQPPKFNYSNDSQSFGPYATRARVRRQHSLQISHQKEHISAMVSRLPDFSSYERHELVVDAGGNKENSHPHSMALRFKQLSIGNSSSHLDVESAHRSEDVRAKTNIFCSTPGPDCHFGNSPTAIRRRRVVRIASLENLPATPIPFQEPISSGASPLKGVNRSLTQTPSSSAIGWFDPQAAKDKCEPTEKEAPLAVLPSVMPTKGGKKSDAFLKRLTRHFRIDNMILNQSYWEIYEAGDARATLLKLCKQTGSYKKFADVFTAHRRKQTIRKLGEGCFGEVFQCTANHVAPADLHSTTESLVAIKVIPIEGSVRFNGDCQKTFSEVLSEVIVSKELTALSLGLTNRTDSFVQLQKLHLVQGRFPSYLTKAWDQFDRERKSENDHPRIFPADQLWLLAEYAFGGSALEDNMPSCPAARLSILLQVGFALAVAEAELKFEHRDLHWGNVLIRQTLVESSSTVGHNGCIYCTRTENGPVDVVKFRLNDRSYEVPTYGFTAVIIDFTLSRLEQDGGLVYVNLAADPALFESRGDYQFDVYRLMRKHNKDQWERFYPRTNVFWLHYLATKLLPESTTPVARHHDAFVQRLTDLERSLSTFGFESACDLVGRHVAFNSCYCE